MADLRFTESNYRFHSPIRLFQANDPYYFEVDNIPLKQLQENDLWLKDQLTRGAKLTNVSRADFDELRPYATEVDNKIKVRPGRYSARVNDIDTSTRLQSITRLAGALFNETNSWLFAFYNSRTLTDSIDKITSVSPNDAMFMNGMAERAFTYPAKDPYNPFIDYRTAPISWDPIIPVQDVLLWAKSNDTNEFAFSNWHYWSAAVGMAPDTQANSLFVKYWRGITRMSIVDVASELEVAIPEFNINDFDYIDENGDRQQRTDAEVRIDLVFIYSKPIDASAVKIIDPKASNGYRKITKPELGIVRGAGVILNKSVPANNALTIGQQNSSGVDEDGNLQILASVADAENSTNGFEGSSIHGSFPSPDDLLNIAPLISETLEATDPLLIGQTILPVAYVVVRKNQQRNADGVQVINNTDLIDIRPFFRTAELTYNERAGIAASLPQISISNPVVSKLELKYETRRIVDDYSSKINALTTQGFQTFPRTVGAGYILGGSRFGVEGAIQHFYAETVDPAANQARLNQLLRSRYGYHPNLLIPELPDWDVADWVFANGLTLAGSYPNDYINTYTRQGIDHQYSCYGNKELTERLKRLGTENLYGAQYDNFVNIHFVKKTIRLDKANIQWMQDYIVNVNLLNCVPLTCRTVGGHVFQYAGAADIWVEKKQNEFTIYCAWVANDPFQGADTSEEVTLAGAQNFKLPINNRDTARFAGFTVLTKELATAPTSNTKFPGEPAAGAAIYPSVTFEIVGIPQGFAGMPTTLQGSNPVITLS